MTFRAPSPVRSAATALVIAALTVTVGCGEARPQSTRSGDMCDRAARQSSESGTGGVYDRARYYASLDELAAASDAIIVGTVLGSDTQLDEATMTRTVEHDIAVDNAVAGTVAADDVITVAQPGWPSDDGTVDGYPIADTILCAADVRLLFLTRDDDGADAGDNVDVDTDGRRYVITGMIAGIYRPDEAADNDADANPDTKRFVRAFPTDLDELPDTIDLRDLRGMND